MVFSKSVGSVVRQRNLSTYLTFLKIEHTLFALPFAYGGMLLAASGWPGFHKFFWISLAMLGARTASMALNRVLDADIDGKNPRTAARAIPAGGLTKADGIIVTVVGFSILVVSAWSLNKLTLTLLPVAVFFLALYPLTKRWTWLCHLWLGLTIGSAAPAGWIAVTGSFSGTAIVLWIGVGLWVTGFDIIYSLLDKEFDILEGIQSIPARFGTKRALIIAAMTHGCALGSLCLAIPIYGFGVPYTLSLIAIAFVLIYSHIVVRGGSAKAVALSFGMNLAIGVIVLVGILIELVVSGLSAP